ncbi:hypothetical protein C5613_33115 [Rhodococcus opacus]|uniref:Uncharacterized protein n=1 Tax=Rhodococcus opacus TaxID=37919 RepID=A0A2S8IT19_RHOOP|nr:hypothetical protein C5613_33115 [Rhodococcus opacus]
MGFSIVEGVSDVCPSTICRRVRRRILRDRVFGSLGTMSTPEREAMAPIFARTRSLSSVGRVSMRSE